MQGGECHEIERPALISCISYKNGAFSFTKISEFLYIGLPRKYASASRHLSHLLWLHTNYEVHTI